MAGRVSFTTIAPVSIRAHQLQRANRAVIGAFENTGHVSIRARQLQRANPTVASSSLAGPVFQSAPANYSGRITAYDLAKAKGNVSIRARQLQRANHCGGSWAASPSCSFNPRPPITAGESVSPT